ncbi:hypothetical protein N7450_005220 [Penicillium hetheringtonii]|nr:hypothetical protein N7450_005220 [Penicillium hetheringtonii]
MFTPYQTVNVDVEQCDKKIPFCGQCVQAGLVCEGYDRKPLVWINSTDGQSRLYSKTSSPPRRSGTSTPNITLHDSLARSTREDRYISSAGWLRYHDGLCRAEKTLRFITLAHSLSMLATRDNDSHLKVKGVQAHRMALQEMRIALQDPQRATGDGLLAAVRLFRFYEILYGAESEIPNQTNPTPQIQGYYAHTDGEMALFMNRGCHREWSDAGRYLLASGRIVSFILGVCRRKGSPFNEPDWMTAPWNGTNKSALEELSDIMVQIPSFLEELDNIRATSVAKRCPEKRGSLLKKMYDVEQELLIWKFSMREDLLIYDYTHSGNPLPKPQVDRDFAVLHLSFFYWSCSILLYTTIHLVTNEADRDSSNAFSSSIPFSSEGCPNFLDERNPTLHAHRIVHALPLSYRPCAGGYTALSSSFPLGMALRYLVVAHHFPHECDSGAAQMEFLLQTVSQPFMGAYVAKFIDHLFKVDTSAQSLKEMTGWYGMELRARGWWFKPVAEEVERLN